MPKIKISQLPAKAANLAATDLLEVSEVSGLTYVSKKITGAELVGNRVPYTGATSDVDLGEYELKAGQIELDQSPTGTAGVAVTRWNDSLGSTETTLKGGSVILKNGVDLVARVVNKVTPNTTLTKAAYPVVKISGAQGQRLAVDYAQANNDNNSADTLGVVTETIATNQEGFIMTVGQLDGINTTGSLQGETWLDGDVLYLSPTVPGAVTKVKPTGATGHIVVIGYVEHAHNVNGKIYVKIMNGWELDELHNVYIDNGTLANNQVLTYESATQLWKNKTPETGITVGTTSSTGTNGRVFFQAGGVVQQDANFTFDNTLKRLTLKAVNTGAGDIPFAVQNSAGTANLVTVQGNGNVGIGIDSPLDRLHISQTVVGSNNILRMTSTSINSNVIRFVSADASTQGSFLATGSTFSYGTYLANQCNLVGGSGGIGLRASNTSNINFYGGNVDADFGVNYFRLFGSTGNVLIQNGGTYTDNGFRLDVNGTTRLNGNTSIGGSTAGARLDVRSQGALSTDIAFRVRNSADTQNLMSIAGNGDVAIGLNATGVTFASLSYISIGQDAKASQIGISIGNLAGKNQDNGDRRNIYIGSDVASSGTNRTAAYNIGIGNRALLSINSGQVNVAIGTGFGSLEGAGESITTASDCVIVGAGAGSQITTGGTNTNIGRYAGAQNVTGASNTQVGYAVDQASGTNKSHITAIGMRLRSSHNGVIMLGSSGNTGVVAPSIADDVAQFHFRSDLQSFFFNKNTNVVLKSNSALVSGTHFEAAATNTITIHNGTAPVANITDAYAQYSADITAGNAAPHFRTENGDIIKLYKNAAVTTPQGIADALTNLGVLTASTIAPSVQSVVSAATVTPVNGNDLVKITAQAAALTLANPTGVWPEGKDLMIRIKDDGLGARAITWDTNYRAIGVTLPTTTVLGKTTYVGVIYNSDDAKWDVIGVTTQA